MKWRNGDDFTGVRGFESICASLNGTFRFPLEMPLFFGIIHFRCFRILMRGADLALLLVVASLSTSEMEGQPPTSPAAQRSSTDPKCERAIVSLTNAATTLVGFRRTTPPPWRDGNVYSFEFRKTEHKGPRPELRASWKVVNINTENLVEICKRLRISEVELHVWHITTETRTAQETGKPERPILVDLGYAIVTDPRIPRKWFFPDPGLARGREALLPDKTVAQELCSRFPQSFRPSDEERNIPGTRKSIK
jgi:hypothetical protein